MADWEYDTSKTGLATIFKDYQEMAMHIIWENPNGVISRVVWESINAKRAEPISRASVINFLESMRKAGVLKGVETTGKGGHRWVYSPFLSEAEFRKQVARDIKDSIDKNLKP